MEPPFPAVHGGRVDVLNRCRALAALGWRLHLVTWVAPDDNIDEAATRAGLAPIFRSVQFLPHARGLVGLLKRLWRLPVLPSHLGARDTPAGAIAAIAAQARKDKVGAVVGDGLYSTHLARWLARALGLPLIYRAHNIEHLYMARQARVATSWTLWLNLRIATLGLKRYETALRHDANWIYDISADDLAWWQARGETSSSWVPPFMVDKAAAAGATGNPAEGGGVHTHDLVYLGNLRTPNNLEGLNWLLDKIMPGIWRVRPQTTLLIAGSRPDPALLERITGQARIECLADPVSASQTRARGRVLINPILTGSGVNVKSVEMLETDVPIVTTAIGVQGLSEEVKAAFLVARDADEFASLVCRALDAPAIDQEGRRQARDAFGNQAAAALSAHLLGLVG